MDFQPLSGRAPLLRAMDATFAALALICMLPVCAGAVTTGTSDVTLAANATVEIQINDAGITLSPDQSDYEASEVTAEGAAGIAVQVRTNSSTGMVLALKSVDGTPGIALADLQFKTQTAPGGSGTSIDDYTVITGSDQNLWTSDEEQPDFVVVDTDIKVTNLWEYLDASGGGTTDYTTTLTYTVTVQ